MTSYFCEICKKNISKSNKTKHEKTKNHMNKKHGGDLQTASSKLPEFPWSKYKGEHHLPKFQYTGRLGLSVF